MTMKYTVTRKSVSKLTKEELAGWRVLLKRSAHSAQIFSSPEFCISVDESWSRVQVVMVREGHSIKLVLPVQRDNGVGGMLGAFSQVGLGVSDYFDVVSDTCEKYDLAAILRKAGVSSLYYSHAPARIKLGKLPLKLTGATYRIVTTEATQNLWEIAQETNPSYWIDAVRKLRRLEREVGPVQFSWHDAGEEVFNILIEAKLQQYTASGHVNAPLFDKRTQATLRVLLDTEGGGCKGLLSVLRARGTIIALHLGLTTRTHLHNWFPVYLQSYSRHSPGKVLLMEILKNAEINGVTSFDFGEGLAEYKVNAANEVEELGVGLLMNGVLGGLSAIPRRLQWRIKSTFSMRLSKE